MYKPYGLVYNSSMDATGTATRTFVSSKHVKLTGQRLDIMSRSLWPLNIDTSSSASIAAANSVKSELIMRNVAIMKADPTVTGVTSFA